jgi:phage N-6-adenine-methyltransferase
MTTPKQKPGRSVQDVRTPPELLRAIEQAFGVREWNIDLAANSDNRIVGRFLGLGSSESEDALAVPWDFYYDCWLNPPFANIKPWVAKCATAMHRGRIFALLPAAVGSNWYAAHVHGVAHVVALSPRVTFVGHKAPYPKDLILAVYGPVKGGFSTWKWK